MPSDDDDSKPHLFTDYDSSRKNPWFTYRTYGDGTILGEGKTAMESSWRARNFLENRQQDSRDLL